VATQASNTPTPSATRPANTPVATSTPQATATPVPGAAVSTAAHAQLGPVLTDGEGRVLYLFTRDERNKSNCYDACAQTWPPLLTQGAPVAEGDGVTAARLGTTARTDGGMQVTYNGWPLYYYDQDAAAGDANGQARGGVWFVVSTYGGPIQTDAIVSSTTHAELGTYLADASGRALYLFTRDAPNTSNCSGNCALNWPPLLTVNDPMVTEEAQSGLLGVIAREDGTRQVTYNGWPLYYYANDVKPGDVVGQNVGGVWYVLTPTGESITTVPGASATPEPTAQATPAAATVNSSITAFDLEDIQVTVGTTVTWTNNHTVPHTVTHDPAGGGTKAFDSGNLVASGAGAYSYTFTQAGTYPYVCVYHSGMAGTVTVV
jgi:predicted lipoprotein with Yx(FWY)xxD motif/plastocyanin